MTFFPRNLLLALPCLALLGGCAAIDNKTVSDEVLARKAAISLNVPDNQVSISDRSSETGLGYSTINFTATTQKGSTHRCYITNAYGGLMKSSAVCAGGACNELLKAAGQCQ